jgi:hypothetical protein
VRPRAAARSPSAASLILLIEPEGEVVTRVLEQAWRLSDQGE